MNTQVTIGSVGPQNTRNISGANNFTPERTTGCIPSASETGATPGSAGNESTHVPSEREKVYSLTFEDIMQIVKIYSLEAFARALGFENAAEMQEYFTFKTVQS